MRKSIRAALASFSFGRTDGGDRVYAFTRTEGDDVVLVAVNFGAAPATVTYDELESLDPAVPTPEQLDLVDREQRRDGAEHHHGQVEAGLHAAGRGDAIHFTLKLDIHQHQVGRAAAAGVDCHRA